ncbi:structure-specific endonuclease subunit SLX4 [Anastrepha ludens]|uniref:structure-specific endonuclease subunit SLX4 n=1 Tax=Anastrepha ludens TaxID=28586 RepID=UPI0023B09CBA|nr:structure-specific endonuclease subunit SLX4 [Anastrepha ludens]
MDRETRKTNLKKLRLSGITHIGECGNGSLRKTRSVNATISKYFKDPIIESYYERNNEVINGDDVYSACSSSTNSNPTDNCVEKSKIDSISNLNIIQPHNIGTYEEKDLEAFVHKKNRKRTSLTDFVLNEGENTKKYLKKRISDKNIEDEFETPVKEAKKASKLRRPRKTSRQSKLPIKNLQPDIKSSLLRSENLFSNITSQQCRIENFSADEIQLALALSKSQIETSGVVCLNPEEDVVDQHGKKKDDNSIGNIQNILQQYGFRAVSTEDYKSLKSVFVPGANRRTKTKWANKFTALTLRDPEFQTKKVMSKIDSLIAQQLDFKRIDVSENLSATYSLLSGELQKLNATKAMINGLEANEKINSEEFYVKNLFEDARVQAGYLLKNWNSIQGRDLSPQRDHESQIKNTEKQMNLIYMKLENHFVLKEIKGSKSNQYENGIFVENCTINDSKKMIIDSSCNATLITPQTFTNLEQLVSLDQDSYKNYIKNSTSIKEESSVTVEAPATESYIWKDLLNKSSPRVDNLNSTTCSTSQSVPRNCPRTHIRNRALSPNIFASSEDESAETINIITTTDNHQKAPNTNNEVSSDMTTSYDAIVSKSVKSPRVTSEIIDLTQVVSSEQPIMTSDIQSKVFQDIKTTGNETLINNFQVFERSNMIERSVDPYELKTHSMMEINLPKSSANRKNMEQFVDGTNTRTKKFTLSPDDSKQLKSSSWNGRKTASFTCIAENISKSLSAGTESSNDNIHNEENYCCEDSIVLSDDEINYSIWKADMSRNTGKLISDDKEFEAMSGTKDSKNSYEYSILDLVECGNFMKNNTNKISGSNTNSLTSEDFEHLPCNLPYASRKTDPSNELLEFGILDNKSEQFTQNPEILITPKKESKLNGSLTPTPTTPVGLDKLLTRDIRFNKTEQRSPTQIYSHTPSFNSCDSSSDEYVIANRVYKTRIVTGQKPDFVHQTEAEILKQLYGFGIKPLKRKQAVKMLEYIYNSTHPLLLPQTNDFSTDSKVEDGPKPAIDEVPDSNIFEPSRCIVPSYNKLQLKDCLGNDMLRFTNELQIDFEYEDYVFQTNITKRTSRPLLPLHIAWYNLVSSSTILHEMILMYIPIDLHEVYAFFKHLGYRFEPKDMKVFLDRRCIIFRYDMAHPGRQSERHIRKNKNKTKHCSM